MAAIQLPSTYILLPSCDAVVHEMQSVKYGLLLHCTSYSCVYEQDQELKA